MSVPVFLGTAQFGAAYGITNTRGRLTDETVREIVVAAVRGGVAGFDTALAYGDAEERLGVALREAGATATSRIITKLRLDEVPDGDLSVLARSNRRLHSQKVDVLLHRPSDVRDPRFRVLRDGLRREQEAGRVGVMGVSVYDRAELEECIEALPDLGLVQVPGNIVDRRLLDDPLLEALSERAEIHVRSVFLQGLLLASPEQIPERHAPLRPVVRELDAQAMSTGTTRLHLLLAAVAGPPVQGVVVGATSVEEINDILTAAGQVPEILELPTVDAIPDELLDPRRW